MRTIHTLAVAGAALLTLGPVDAALAAGAPAARTAPQILTVKTVTNTNPTGAGSLRAAFFKVNNPALAWDTIHFNIPGNGAHVITPNANLPALTAAVTIDGYTQPGTSPADDTSSADLGIVIDGSNMTTGLRIDADDTFVSGLDIRDTGGDGIVITGDDDTISGCYVGVKVKGESAGPNAGVGIDVRGDRALIGGTTAAERNLVSGNDDAGIAVTGNNVVIVGDRIGTDDDGASAVPNGADGIDISAGNSPLVGGAGPNLVSGNAGNGILVRGGLNAEVIGNLVGTDATGSLPLGNSASGIRVDNGGDIVSGNVVGGNALAGIEIRQDGMALDSNQVGIALTAGAPASIPNGLDGIFVDADASMIGTEDAGNLVGRNGRNGIAVQGNDHTIVANFVGIDPDGSLGLGNTQSGITINGRNNHIGAADPALGNVSSQNGAHGIVVDGPGGAGHHIPPSWGNVVENNLVGLDPTGLLPRPNILNGIFVRAPGTLVDLNSVAFNGANGIKIDAFIVLTKANTIWQNGAAGVDVARGTGNTIVTNSITDDGGIGIDLEPIGVTANDVGDPDLGPNDLLNWPILTAATSGAGGTTVSWQILQGLGSATFQLEFFASATCDASGFGESTTPLGTTIVATNAAGNASGTVTVPGLSSPGQVATATATLVTTGSTSELSACRLIT